MAKELKELELEQKILIPIDGYDEDDDELSFEEVQEEKLLELQLTMATTSINHEYARIEFDETVDYERKGELLDFMAECRSKYNEARGELVKFNPQILDTFERDLILQKLTTITHYYA